MFCKQCCCHYNLTILKFLSDYISVNVDFQVNYRHSPMSTSPTLVVTYTNQCTVKKKVLDRSYVCARKGIHELTEMRQHI